MSQPVNNWEDVDLHAPVDLHRPLGTVREHEVHIVWIADDGESAQYRSPDWPHWER
jgi:hypothetical protein